MEMDPYVALGIIHTMITLPTGAALIIAGLLLWKKQKIGLIHEYHHKNVRAQDVKAYTKCWGIGLFIFGLCVLPIGFITLIFHSSIGWILFAVGAAVCFILGHKAQKTYNFSWFS